MKSKLNKTLIAGAVMAALGLASSSASAIAFPDFTFDAPTKAPFVADKMTGNYTEVITFTSLTTFDVSIAWVAGQFVKNDGNTALNALTTGLGSDYGLYATFYGTGTVALGPVTTFTLTPGGTFNLFYDAYVGGVETSITAPALGGGAFTFSDDADDSPIATGGGLYGSGSLDTGCAGGINCGSFGQTTSFVLNALGSSLFTAPVPFYNLSFQSGQFNSFVTEGTQTINGSLDVVFGVPEPTTLALMGLGLVGLGLGRRNRNAA
jgi:hypothetical protein